MSFLEIRLVNSFVKTHQNSKYKESYIAFTKNSANWEKKTFVRSNSGINLHFDIFFQLYTVFFFC